MDDREIMFEQKGHLGLITLNRPKVLNALSLDMILAMTEYLRDWAVNPSIRVVAVRGAGDKAFCAGGDVKAIYHAGLSTNGPRDIPGAPTYDYFFHEYRLNVLIYHFPKPYVALLDGIVMGGGVGVSAHGSHRIVTEKTLFAMPETAIGLFTDVGAGHFMPRFPGETGTYLALTGDRLTAHDCLYTGFGTDFVVSGRIDELIAALQREDDVDAVLSTFRSTPQDYGHIEGIRGLVDQYFSAETVEGILERLAGDGGQWAGNTLAHLRKMCPRSLKYTLRQHRLGLEEKDFNAEMITEFRLSQACMRSPDYYEGVRALLIDKDKMPKWQPACLEDMSEQMVDEAFAPPAGGDIHFNDLMDWHVEPLDVSSA